MGSKGQKPGIQQLSSQHETSCDAKGRIGLPQHFRKHLGDEVTVLKWKDHLMVIHPDNFEQLAGFVGQRLSLSNAEGVRNFFNPKARRDRRYFFGNKFDLSFDAQGRLTIPKTLRDSLDLYSDVIWVGCGDYVELWAKKHYTDDCARWEEAGGYDELFADEPPLDNPSAHEDGSGDEGEPRS